MKDILVTDSLGLQYRYYQWSMTRILPQPSSKLRTGVSNSRRHSKLEFAHHTNFEGEPCATRMRRILIIIVVENYAIVILVVTLACSITNTILPLQASSKLQHPPWGLDRLLIITEKPPSLPARNRTVTVDCNSDSDDARSHCFMRGIINHSPGGVA